MFKRAEAPRGRPAVSHTVVFQQYKRRLEKLEVELALLHRQVRGLIVEKKKMLALVRALATRLRK